jgi:thiosulfate dehydrogenase [quinone] large subunit
MNAEAPLTRFQQVSLVLLRTLVGWHFLYEGYFKLWRPAWTPDGAPLAPWSAAGYLRGATGPLAGLFHRLADSPWLGVIDTAMTVALIAAGLSLILGILTEAGCALALALLALFYVSSIPISGVHQPGAEGAYLLVNKNLVEAGGVLVLLAFGTSRIAGLDRLWRWRRHGPAQAQEVTS